MPLMRLPYIKAYLNNSNDPTASEMTEPITGLPLPSGMVAGSYFDLTREEALKYSLTTIGTLLEGRYMRVQLDTGATVAGGSGGFKKGQLLFWKLGNAGNKYLVTNVEPAGSSMIAGIAINDATIAPVTPLNWFWMQAISPGRATVQFKATITNGSAAIGDAVYAANAGAGADAGLVDDGPLVTLANSSQFAGRFIGVAETAPVNATASVIQIVKAGPVMI